jgi:predicted TIM-barrel fold metal-dependent hydrolase
MSDTPINNDPQWYWDNHMMASFVLDPLGLELIDHIGVDKAMWSTDFPHNESTYGYSNRSLGSVVEAVGVERALPMVCGNAKRFLGVD